MLATGKGKVRKTTKLTQRDGHHKGKQQFQKEKQLQNRPGVNNEARRFPANEERALTVLQVLMKSTPKHILVNF